MKYVNFRYKYATLVVLLLSTLIMQISASQSSPSIDQEEVREINVLFLEDSSYWESQSLDTEYYLNYENYGDTRINIVDRVPVETTLITSEYLAESQADVLYLVNLHQRKFETGELNAILAYLNEGHGLIGTHETINFEHMALSPVFGINPDVVLNGGYNVFPITDHMNINNTVHPLYKNMPETYFVDRTMTASINGKASPWSDDPAILLENGTILGASTTGEMAVIYAEGEKTKSVYFTHNPSESSMSGDLTLLYNSFVWASMPATQSSEDGTDTNTDASETTITGTNSDSTTYVYETVTVTNDSESGPSVAGIDPSIVPVRFDAVLFSLFFVGLIYSNIRRRGA